MSVNYLMPFEKAEYMQRLEKVKKSMVEQGIDVLFITDISNICYVTGYNAWAFCHPEAAIVSLDDDMPLFIGRYMDAFSGVVKTTYLDKEHAIGYPDYYVNNPVIHPMEFMADIMIERGMDKKTIGIENDVNFFTAKCRDALVGKLPNAKFVNANLLVNWVRLVKSDAEIELIRRAGQIAVKGMEACYNTIGEGVRQCDVAAEVQAALIKGTDEYGGDYAAGCPVLPYGEYAGAPHITWTEDRYENNTSVYIEFAGVHYRYHCPIARTIAIGTPSKVVTDCAKAAIEGLENALAKVKPGVTCDELANTYLKTVERYGFEKESRLGYPVGIAYPVDWGEHTASIRKGDMTVLQPNMAFHMIPGMYYDDFGVSISQTFRVTENGVEKMYDFPYEVYQA